MARTPHRCATHESVCSPYRHSARPHSPFSQALAKGEQKAAIRVQRMWRQWHHAYSFSAQMREGSDRSKKGAGPRRGLSQASLLGSGRKLVGRLFRSTKRLESVASVGSVASFSSAASNVRQRAAIPMAMRAGLTPSPLRCRAWREIRPSARQPPDPPRPAAAALPALSLSASSLLDRLTHV